MLLTVCLQSRTWVKAALRVFIRVNLPPIGWLSEHEPGPDCVHSETCSRKLRGLDWLHRLKQPVLGYRTGIDWLNGIKTWSARSALMTDNLFLEAPGTLFKFSMHLKLKWFSSPTKYIFRNFVFGDPKSAHNIFFSTKLVKEFCIFIHSNVQVDMATLAKAMERISIKLWSIWSRFLRSFEKSI